MNNEVHLWIMNLAEVALDQSTLSLEERRRIFINEAAQRQFIKSRVLLRQILGEYVGVTPDKLRFQYGWRGKPALSYPVTPLRFNHSHSNDCYLLGITWEQEIGVDVEQIRPIIGVNENLDDYFSQWVRQEALLKATGQGLGGKPPQNWHVQQWQISPNYQAAVAVMRPNSQILFLP